MDEPLIHYLLDDLPPDDRAGVAARAAADPTIAARLDRLRRLVAALEAERGADDLPPPAGLAERTVAHTAEYLVAHAIALDGDAGRVGTSSTGIARQYRVMNPGEFGSSWFPAWLRRVDVAVAAFAAVLVVGIGLVGVEKLRSNGRVYACQDRLRDVHQSLVSYHEVHDGRYPQVGTQNVPVAGAFADELAQTGHLPDRATVACPVVPTTPVGYAYTLGYRDPAGRLHGVVRGDRPDATGDGTPVVADLPGADEPVHGGGQNVLYAGGHVRYANTPTVGVDGDHIYTNQAGLIGAGLHRNDAALGRPGDTP